MNAIYNSFKIVLLAVFISSVISCKSTKKTTTATNAAAEKTKMEQEEALRKQKEEELKRKQAEEERVRMEAEAASNAMKESAPKVRLNEYFTAIANSSTVASANNSINEALGMFASTETPVLIVISEEAGKKDYDRPTTIKAYLNYLKDQKKNINNIENLKVDGSGKITEVELRKIN